MSHPLRPSHLAGMEPFVRESLGALARPSGRIDREKGVVYGVRVVNPESGNGRYYPPAVLKRDKAAYEGRAVYWGHRKNPLDADDPTHKFGRLVNVREADGGGLQADLHFNPEHPQAKPFLWACEHNPSLYSLSHHARIGWERAKDGQGRKVAGTIAEVASVDIVSEGGTTGGVFESLADIALNGPPPMNPKDPQTIAALVAGLPDPAALSDFLAALFGALPSGVFGPQTKLDALSNFMDKLDGETTPESLRRRGKVGVWAAEALAGFQAKEAKAVQVTKAKELIAAAKLPAAAVTDVFVETVTESLGKSEDAAKALIADRKAVVGAGPRTSVPGGGGNKTAKERAAEFTV